ncbi:MAG: hypothetical protein M3198_19055 [Actinomycetota bacterium]|nr:hypothetical protein [Actinomycetota bacterium]
MRPSRLLEPVALLLLVSLGSGACTSDELDRLPGSLGPSGSGPFQEASPEEPSTTPGKEDTKKPDEKDEPRIVDVPGGAKLMALPDKASALCDKGPPLSRACPELVPVVHRVSYIVDSFGRPGGRFQVLELAAGAPSAKDLAHNSPPRVAHVVIETGRPQFLIDLGPPSAGTVPLESVLGEHLNAPQTVSLDKAWGWKEKLVLAPSFPFGGAHGDHLMYRWEQGGIEHVVSLHAWAPAGEAVRTLHAIVRSIKKA